MLKNFQGYTSSEENNWDIALRHRLTEKFSADYVSSFWDGLALVWRNNLWFYVDKMGERVVSGEYDEARHFLGLIASVRKGEDWFLIDGKGKKVGNEVFDDIYFPKGDRGDIDESEIQVRKNGKYFYIDRSGNRVMDREFDRTNVFRNGVAVVHEDGKDFLINKIGETVSDRFDTIENFSEGIAVVKRDGKEFFIRADGSEVTNARFDHAWKFREGLAQVSKGGKWFFIRADGSEITHERFDENRLFPASSFHEGFAFVVQNNDRFFIDREGRRVTKERMRSTKVSHSDIASAVKGGDVQFLVDENGNRVVEDEYGPNAIISQVRNRNHDASARVFLIREGSACKLIDSKGKKMMEDICEMPMNFLDVYIYDVTENWMTIKKGSKWHLMDLSGKQLSKESFDDFIRSFSGGGVAVFRNTGEDGIILVNTRTGKRVTCDKFYYVHDRFYRGVALVERFDERDFILLDRDGGKFPCKDPVGYIA